MQRLVLSAIMLSGMMALLIAGCPRGGNTDTNTPDTNTPDTNDPNAAAAQLTETQATAVDFVVNQLAAAGAAWGTFASLSDARLDPNTMGFYNTYGTCPIVTFIAADSAAIQFDFGTGCSSTATGGMTISGSANVSLVRATRAVTVTFQNLTIATNSLTGTLTATLQRVTNGAALNGQCNLTTANIRTVSGQITVQFTTDGLITIPSATVTFTHGTVTQDVTLSNAVLDPINNHNFLPEAGTATFAMPAEGGSGTVLIVVTFGASTPVDGTVQVKIGAAAPGQYKIPGIGS
jgi:hypothetical protein